MEEPFYQHVGPDAKPGDGWVAVGDEELEHLGIIKPKDHHE